MEPKSLIVLLKEHRDYVSATERNIIDVVVTDPESAVGLSVHELAAKAFVSPSTVSRLCKRLRVGGYKGFQRMLVYDLAVMREKDRATIEDIKPGDSTRGIMYKICRRNMESIAITEKLNDSETIDECVRLMSSARAISLFGMGSSLLSARDLYYKLLRVNVACNVCDDWHAQLVCALNGSPDDLAIAFSYSGRTNEVIQCARAAHEQGTPVVAITRAGYDSELVSISDLILYVSAAEPLLRSSAGASRISQLAVVDMLFATYVTRNYERCAEAVGKNYIER